MSQHSVITHQGGCGSWRGYLLGMRRGSLSSPLRLRSSSSSSSSRRLFLSAFCPAGFSWAGSRCVFTSFDKPLASLNTLWREIAHNLTSFSKVKPSKHLCKCWMDNKHSMFNFNVKKWLYHVNTLNENNKGKGYLVQHSNSCVIVDCD